MAAKRERKAREIVARYNYRDAAGVIIYQVCVYTDGARSVRSPDAHDPSQWRWGRARWGVPAVPYRLPELIAAAASGSRAASVVWVVPTEEDADALAQHGIVATCCAQEKGADGGGWDKGWAGWFKGFMQAVVICGTDTPGRGKLTCLKLLEDWRWRLRAEEARKGLEACRLRSKVLELPEIGGKRPFGPAQWFDLGGSVDGLIAAVRGAAPWSMPEDVMEIFLDAGYTMDDQEEISAALRGEKPAQRPAHERPAAASSPSSPAPLSSSPSAIPPRPSSEQSSESVGVGGGDDDPRSVAYLRGVIIKEVFCNKQLDKFGRREAFERIAVEWLLNRGKLFYHSELKTHGTSLYFDSVDKRLSYIARDYFGSWLALAMGVNPASNEFKFVLSRVAAEAMAGTKTEGIVPERFWARRGNRVYLSCGRGRMVRCSPEGAEVVDVGTDKVLFEEGGECEPWELLPGYGANPFRGSEGCEVFTTMNAIFPRGKTLLELWATSLPGHGDSTKPILLLSGRARSGKTRLALSIMELYGIPSKATALSKTYKDTDFWTLADSGGVMCLDNADSFIDWLPGCLATVATCGSFSKKMNYKDNELITQRARCWCVVTGTQPSFASDSGVADRLLTIELYSRAAGDTKESSLREDISKRRNAGLTWICRAWCDALADESSPPSAVNSRHPDWGVTAYRLARAINIEDEAVDAMTESEAGKAIFALRNDSLGACLIDAFGESGFAGSASDMAEKLKASCDDFDGEKTWTLPKLGKALKRLDPHLVAAFAATRANHHGSTNYVFKPIAPEFLTPTMLGVDDVCAQNAHAGVISRDLSTQPLTPLTSQKTLEGEGGEDVFDSSLVEWADEFDRGQDGTP